ncbi:MAG: Spore cortex-lytic enzyme [Firmicutes bacterium]|nr:Spore cortex-lytic enzyme [Bacillota bacterium]
MRKLICAVLVVVLIVLLPLISLAEQPGSRNLRQGDSGADVTEVQRRLQRWGYYEGPISGTFGPRTLAAVQAFQRRHGLPVTGIISSRTFAALGIAMRPAAAVPNRTAAVAPTRGVSPNDLQLLARAVYGEARGEPFEGQVKWWLSA